MAMVLGKDERTQQLLKDLEQALDLEHSMVLALNYRNVVQTQKAVGDIKETLERILLPKANDTGSEAGKLESRIRQRLVGEKSAEKNVKNIFDKNKNDLVSGTAAWLREESLFQEWEKGEIQVLWLVGDAGLGKSYLATSLIQDFQARRDQRTATARLVAYFFIKEDDDELRDANIILKTVAWQLQFQDEAYRKHVGEVLTGDVTLSSTEETWKSLFVDFYLPSLANSATMVIIDGLDEADETRVTLLRLLAGRGREKTSDLLQFIIIGRKEMLQTDSLHLDPNCVRKQIEVGKSKSSMDIEKYVRKRINAMKLFRQLRKTKGETLARQRGSIWAKKILHIAQGVFLLVKLFLDEIEFSERSEDVEDALDRPPSGLHQMIQRLFRRLEEDARGNHTKQMVRLILLHTSYSRRTALVGEVDVLLNAINGGTGFVLWECLTTELGSIFDLTSSEQTGDDVEVKEGTLPDDSETRTPDGVLDLDFRTDEEWDGGEAELDELDFDLDIQEEKTMGRVNTFTKWEFDTALTEDQIKAPLRFSHQLILEGIRQGSQTGLSLLPDAETAEIDMSLNCLRILRAILPASRDWHFLADYSLRSLAFHLKRAIVQEHRASDAQRRGLLEHLHWLFGTERGTGFLIKAIHGSQLRGLAGPSQGAGKTYDMWNHESFWETWVATNENLLIVQAWLRTWHRVSWPDGSHAIRAWCETVSESLAELLRRLTQAAVTQWLQEPDFTPTPWEFFLAAAWVSMVQSGTRPEFKRPDFDTILPHLGPNGIELVASQVEKPLDTIETCSLGTYLVHMSSPPRGVYYLQKAVEMDPSNWRAQNMLAYTYTLQPGGGPYKSVAHQVLAHSICLEDAKMAGLAAPGGLLDNQLRDYVSAIGNDDKSMHGLMREIKTTHPIEYHALAVSHLISLFPEFAAILGVLLTHATAMDAQLLADTMELVLSKKQGIRNTFSQGYDLFRVAASMQSNWGQDAFTHLLDLVPAVLPTSPKISLYKSWSTAYHTKLYIDRILSAEAEAERATWMLRLQKLSSSSFRNLQSDCGYSERLMSLLPRIYLSHVYNKFGTSQSDLAEFRQAAAPWVLEQISKLETPEMESKKSQQWRLLTLTRVLSVLDPDAANTLYAVLLGHTSLSCEVPIIVDMEPEKGSIGFDVGDIAPRCDGPGEQCKPDITVCTEMWRCEICPNQDWCGSCLDTLATRNDEQCSRNHIFRQIWPVPLEAYAERVVWHKGQVWIRENWWVQFRIRWRD
ncbi:hypothetical protein B0I35DRAFT_447106 [Stachybotrys elegans]|uniref:Nephrocystin 3-like N-terminal domain-containing protein n=1 Tax=Stachybotrys elegans TaxID=80388 RepID=A0A8K0WJQ1_9HYPO|nr:hypothetical protein B0I35DRAFT_447106 [Stachybotrys elegans]